MISNDIIIRFYGELFSWAEVYLKNEITSDFPRLTALRDENSDVYLKYIRDLKPSELAEFIPMAVRRCLPPQFLDYIQPGVVTAISPAKNLYLKYLDSVLSRQFQDPISVLTTKEKKAFRRDVFTCIGGAKISDSTVRLSLEDFIIETHVDIGGRHGVVSYSHHVLDKNGIRITDFPISVSSWCGISSITSWAPNCREDLERALAATHRHTLEFYEFMRQFDK